MTCPHFRGPRGLQAATFMRLRVLRVTRTRVKACARIEGLRAPERTPRAGPSAPAPAGLPARPGADRRAARQAGRHGGPDGGYPLPRVPRPRHARDAAPGAVPDCAARVGLPAPVAVSPPTLRSTVLQL